jgi:hypothetical protein
MTIDLVRQPLFVPQSTGANIPVALFDDFVHLPTNTTCIAGVFVRVEQEQALVKILTQFQSPMSWQAICLASTGVVLVHTVFDPVPCPVCYGIGRAEYG